MPSLKRSMIAQVQQMVEEDYKDSIHVTDIIRDLYPGLENEPGLLNDAREKLSYVRKKVEEYAKITLVPLSQYHFDNYPKGSDPPPTDREARKCISGVAPTPSSEVGFRAADGDIYVKVWMEARKDSAIGTVRSHVQVASDLDHQGIQEPKLLVSEEIRSITEKG